MTKPTGRPRGRPKTKEYVTLMARVPQDLAEQVQRYAGRKRQTISDVLRDGLLVLLQDDDTYRPFTSDRNTVLDIKSDTKEDEEELPAAHSAIVSDMNVELEEAAGMVEEHAVILSDAKGDSAYLASDAKEEQPVIMSDTKKARRRKQAKRDNVSDMNMVEDVVSDKKEDNPNRSSGGKKSKAPIVSDTKSVPAKKKQAKRTR